MSTIQLKKATRQQVKLRLGLSAVSGGGKTYSALLLAYGMTNDWSKIAIIDTENGSGSLYTHLGDYNTIDLQAPYTPERYIECIKACEAAGIEVCIIDSITHEWDGKGGIIEISNSMTGNSFTNWAKITPRHDAFINAILQSKMHMITSVRRKQDYEMTKGTDGKVKVEKAGLKEVTREGFEYELTVNFNLDTNHHATASKDRTGLFMDKPEFIITAETGKKIMEWCNQGIDTEAEKQKAIASATAEMYEVKDEPALRAIWTKYKQFQSEPFFIAAKDQMKVKLTPQTADKQDTATQTLANE